MAAMAAGGKISKVQLYVGNLPESYMSQDLEAEFSKFGALADFFVSIRAGRHRGFGFVEFEDPACAAAAEKAMNGAKIGDATEGKGMRVTFARQRPDNKKPKRKSQQSGGSGGSGSQPRRASGNKDRGKASARPAADASAQAADAPAPASAQAQTAASAPVAAAPPKKESPYKLLADLYVERLSFLNSQSSKTPTPAQISGFVYQTDSMVRKILAKCEEDFGRAPPPSVISFVKKSFLEVSWTWDEADSTKSSIVAGSAPPTVEGLVSWCSNGASHFTGILQQKMGGRS